MSDVPRSVEAGKQCRKIRQHSERGNLDVNKKSSKSISTRAISNLAGTYSTGILQNSAYLFYTTHPMSTNCITTHAKNAAQHPGLLIPKQTRHTSDEVAVSRRAKEDAKREKEDIKKAGIKRVAEFEQNQADKNAMERTPRVVTKPNPLARTRSYADVLRAGSSDVEMTDGTGQPGSSFKLAAVEAGQTTDDGMETAVQDLPPRIERKKNLRFFFLIC